MFFGLFHSHEWTKWQIRNEDMAIIQYRVCRTCGKHIRQVVQKNTKHVHRWEEWEVLQEGPVVDSNGARIGYYKCLERTCKTCGDKQSKKITW